MSIARRGHGSWRWQVSRAPASRYGATHGPWSTVSNEEAKAILTSEFLKLRALTYQDLADRLADEVERFEAVGLSGTTYNVELQGYWDDDEHRDLRVIASIDDGGLRTFLPFTDAFTINPAGKITEHSPA